MRLRAEVRRLGEPVDSADDALVDAGRLFRLRVVLVVERHVVEDILAVVVHPLDAVADDRRQLVGERRVVRPERRDGRRQDVGVAVLVLEAFAVEGRPTRGRAHHEPAAAGVGELPDLVAGPLEPEHRVEDVERDHREAVGGVRRRGGLERRHRARLGDPLLEDLAVDRFAVRQDEVRVDRLIALAKRRVDPDLLEEWVHAERPGLVRDDRHDPRPELLVPDEVPQDPGEDHRGRDGRLRAAGELRVDRRRRLRQRRLPDGPPRDEPTERLPPLAEVLDLFGVRARVVVRRVLELRVGDRQLEPVAEDLQLRLVELLRLVGDVAGLDTGTEGPALDGLGEDHGRCTLRLDRGLVGGVDLAVVVAAAAELGEVVVRQVLDELAQPRVGPEEVLSDVRPAGDRELLELAVEGVVHLLNEDAVDVTGEELVPLARPDHLDHVPAGAAEHRLELLDDLAVAADGTVQALEVAVDDERQVVEALAGGDVERTERLRLVGLAVAEERPHA